MADVHDHDTQSKFSFARPRGRTGRPLQPPGAPSTLRRNYPVHSTAFRKDPAIERSLRRIKGRPQIESASHIISFLARRGTDIQTLRGLAEAIAALRPGWQVVRALSVLRSAVMKDRQAAVLLPALFLRNPFLLQAKTGSLIIFGRMYPLISDSGIIDSLSPEEVEILAAAYRRSVSLFPRPETHDVFFAVLNEKIQQEKDSNGKKIIASAWAERLISILNRVDRRCLR